MLESVASMSASEYVKVVQPMIFPMQQVEWFANEIKARNENMKSKVASAGGKSFLYAFLTGGTFWLIGIVFLCNSITVGEHFSWSTLFNLDALFFLVMTCIAFFWFNALRKKKVNHLKIDVSNTISSMVKDRNKLTGSMYQTLQDYVPQEYWYTFALQKIVGYLQNGRAIYPMQAFNLFEEEMHRMRMEQMQQEIMIANQKQVTWGAISAIANISTAISVSNRG